MVALTRDPVGKPIFECGFVSSHRSKLFFSAREPPLEGRKREPARGGCFRQGHSLDEAQRHGDAFVGLQLLQNRINGAERIDRFGCRVDGRSLRYFFGWPKQEPAATGSSL